MKKMVKILLKTLGIILLTLIILIISVPFIFKNQLKEKALEELNKQVKAEVSLRDFRLNLIKNFPNFNMALEGLVVVGEEQFAGDTIVAFQSFSMVVDVMSVIVGEQIEVKSIILDKPVIHAIVLEDGTANWDIMEASEDTLVVEDTVSSGETPDFKISLKKFAINHAIISYEDKSSHMSARLDDLNFLLSGDMTKDFTDLNIQSRTEAINFVMDGMRYLKNATLDMNAKIGADLANMVFTFKENEISLNRLTLGFDGVVKMPDEDIDVDMTFQTRKTTFKSLLSMVPAVYMKDFESVQTDGLLALNGYAKGVYSSADSILPDIGLDLSVENAMFKYPDLPKSVDHINILTRVRVDGKNMDLTTVDVNKFQLSLAGNPVDAEFHIRTPISDPDIAGKIIGKIDLVSIADVIPLEDMEIQGIIDSKIEMGGKMSMIEQEKYEDFKADGNVTLTDFVFSSSDLPGEVLIKEAIFNFSPRFVELANFDCIIGKSDMRFVGRMENFIPYVFENKTLSGNFTFSSNMLDVNEFMPDSTETETIPEDTAAYELTVIEVPKNLDFILNSSLNKVLYDELEITDLKGVLRVKEGAVKMENLTMNLLKGSMLMNGQYNTQDMTKPFVDYDMDMKDIDIRMAFDAFNTVQKLAPIAKNMNGRISTKITLTSLIGNDMMPVMNSIDGYGKIQSDDIELISPKTFEKMAGLLKLGENTSNTLQNMNASFHINDGRVRVDPFPVMYKGIGMVISGTHGLDQTMDYKMKMKIPRNRLGSGANQVMENLASKAFGSVGNFQLPDEIAVNAKVTGNMDDPKVGLDMAGGEAKSTVKEQVKTTIKEEVTKQKEELETKAREEVNQQADKIMEEARVKADQVRKTAQETAAKVKEEGYKQAEKLEKEAKGNVFKEVAAKKGADKLRKEADKKSEAIIREADEKAGQIMTEAEKKANALKNK